MTTKRSLAAIVLLATMHVGCGDGGAQGKPGVVDTSLTAAVDSVVDSLVDSSSTIDTPPDTSSTDTGTVPLAFTVAPIFVLSTNPAAPLVGRLTAETSGPSSLVVTTTVGDESWVHTFGPDATAHEHTVLRFFPDTEHTLEVVAVSGEEFVAAPTVFTFRTPPLPDSFPVLRLQASRPSEMEPGVILFAVESTDERRDDYILIVDGLGRVLWYYADKSHVNEVVRLQNGNLAYLYDRDRIIELDMWGQEVGAWTSALTPKDEAGTPVDTYCMHHGFVELPNGHLATLSVEVEDVEAMPVSEDDRSLGTAPQEVVGEVLAEFDRDGTVVGEWKLHDILDIRRVGRGSISGPWWRDYLGPALDWGHANALWYDAETDAYLVSLRHQDAALAFSRSTGALQWILAPNANWNAELVPYLLEATDGGADAYHTHGMDRLPDGRMLFFDNGNFRASAWEPVSPAPERSRVVLFGVDADLGTRTTEWEWDGLVAPFSDYGGDADWLPSTGHVLVASGHEDDRHPDGDTAHLYEVDPATDEVVFQLAIGSGFRGVYQVVHFPDLYP